MFPSLLLLLYRNQSQGSSVTVASKTRKTTTHIGHHQHPNPNPYPCPSPCTCPCPYRHCISIGIMSPGITVLNQHPNQGSLATELNRWNNFQQLMPSDRLEFNQCIGYCTELMNTQTELLSWSGGGR